MSGPSFKEVAPFGEFLKLLRQRKALIFLIASVVVLATALVTMILPKWYVATTKIRVEKPEGQVKLFQAQSLSHYDPYFIQDQFEIIQSPKILYQVIDNLDLNSRFGRTLNEGIALPTDITFRYLRGKMLRVESRRSTSLIEISVYSQDPVLGAAIANEIARVYSEDRINLAVSEQSDGLLQLRKELESQEQVVMAQRDLVENLRRDLNISGVDITTRHSDMEIETLRQMQTSLISLRVEAIGRKTRWERFRVIAFDDRLNLVNAELIQDANIQNLLQAYLLADQNLARLKGRLGTAHPDLISAHDSRDKIKEQLDGLLRGYEQALEISYLEAQSRVSALEEQLAQARVDQILSARDKMRPFEEAVQRLDDETKLLTTVKLTLRQREIDFQVPKKTIEILNTAEPARNPSRPSWPLNMALATFVGVIFGVGLALSVEYFDTSFRDVADVESELGLPVLGIIPSRNHADQPTASIETEPFRVLHTGLDLAGKTANKMALIILSAGPGEGKSTTLRELARAMAAAGERVLLIDSDLRRPTQHRFLPMAKDPGLTDLLAGRVKVAEVLRKDVEPNLDLIASGSSGEGSSFGLLQARRLRALLGELKTDYDRILLDSPPILGVSDAAVLASLADSAMLLIQHRRNPKAMTARAKQTIDSLGVPILGVILNQVPLGGSEDYNYYTSNYEYYHAESREKVREKTTASRDPIGAERLTWKDPTPS